MKRLAGGEDVKADSEPWFATLVRIGQNKDSNGNACSDKNTSELNDSRSEQSDQEQNANRNASLDSTLDILNYNNNMSSNGDDFTLDTENNRPFCGATLLSDRYVITSASCVADLNLDQFIVLLNLYSLNAADSRDMIKVRPDKIILHPQYDAKLDLNNLALIRLVRTIEFRFDLNVLPLCLDRGMSGNQLDYYPGSLYTLGYGRLTNDSLTNPLTVGLSTLTNSRINSNTNSNTGLNSLNSLNSFLSPMTSSAQPKPFPTNLQRTYFRQDFFWCFLFYSNRFMENRICTVDNRLLHLTIRDVCEKDTGGPLVWFDSTMNAKTLIGISQSGYCTGFLPPAFTKIRSYLDWINQMTIDSEYCRYPDLN